MTITSEEMRGILKGKCLPGDLRVNEEIPDYLARKFADQAARIARLDSMLTEAVEALKSSEEELEAKKSLIDGLKASLESACRQNQELAQQCGRFGARVAVAERKMASAEKELEALREQEVAAYRYRFTKPDKTDSAGHPWVGDWKYCNAEDPQGVNRSPGYEVQELFTRHAPVAVPDEPIKAVKMTDIQRYGVQGFKDAVPASKGKYVLLEDHSAIVAALQEQVQQLAAEKENARDVMLYSANNIAYAIFNLSDKKLSDLKRGLSDTTCPTDSALLAERELRSFAAKLRAGEQP